MDACGGSESKSPVWPIVDDNGAVDMNGTMDNLEERIANLEMVFTYLKNKKMLERQENKSKKETHSSDGTTNEDIAEFKVASKSTSSTFKPKKDISRRMKIPILDPPASIFANHLTSLFECDFVSLDPRLESRKSAIDNSFTLGSNEEAYHVNILQSCNGLLLCSGWGSPAFYYVYNPSTNLFKRLPQPDNSHDFSILHTTGVLRMAFDPTKSRDYKVVQLFACLHAELEIQVYSSETGNWSLCRDQGSNFLQSFGGREGSYDPMFIQIDIHAILHMQRRLFELHGCLLLVSRDDIDSCGISYIITWGRFLDLASF
ncbi:hypothetical protein Tco_0593150 [Tanacetum coccineum]